MVNVTNLLRSQSRDFSEKPTTIKGEKVSVKQQSRHNLFQAKLKTIYNSTLTVMPLKGADGTQQPSERISVMHIKLQSILKVFILLSLFASVSSDCIDTINSQNNSRCRLCFIDNQFTNCTICQSPASDGTCQQSDQLFHNQAEQCRPLCCHQQQGQFMSDEAKQYCRSSEDESAVKNFGLIVAMVIIGICVLIVLVQAIYACYQCQQEKLQGVQLETAQVINIEDLQENHNPGVVKSRTFLLNPKEQCSICLQGKTNIMTKCGHYFHSNCLGNWFDRNAKCPLCLSQDFNPVILYCGECYYRICGLKVGKNHGHNAEDMAPYTKAYCEICKESHPEVPQIKTLQSIKK